MSEIASPQMSLDPAIRKIEKMFIEMMKDCYGPSSKELVGIARDDSHTLILYAFTEKYIKYRLFFKKKGPPVRRYILRITHVLLAKQVTMFNQGVLKCELFLNDQRLRNIAQLVLEPLKEKVWFRPGVEYIDMSNDPLAWYPDERKELPKAQPLKAL